MHEIFLAEHRVFGRELVATAKVSLHYFLNRLLNKGLLLRLWLALLLTNLCNWIILSQLYPHLLKILEVFLKHAVLERRQLVVKGKLLPKAKLAVVQLDEVALLVICSQGVGVDDVVNLWQSIRLVIRLNVDHLLLNFWVVSFQFLYLRSRNLDNVDTLLAGGPCSVKPLGTVDNIVLAEN